MPSYDFTCNKCASVVEMLVPSGTLHRKHKGDCGGRMRRLFPVTFSALNCISANGERFKGLEISLGQRPESVGDQSRIMEKLGCRPADSSDRLSAAPRHERKEITEKELYEVLNS